MPLRPLTVSLHAAARRAPLTDRPICPACQFNSLLRLYRVRERARSQPLARTRSRHASTLSSATAVNAAKDIPSELQALHSAAARLNKDALNYVNISRLQLALRSLESHDPVVRIAVLGLQNNRTARRLARLLVADVLSEEAAWEKHLEAADDQDTRSVILKYGNEADLPPPNSLATTIHIPSPILRSFNIEILISSLNLDTNSQDGSAAHDQLETTALVPLAETPRAFGGPISFVRYPVHRALVVAEDVSGALILGKFVGPSNKSRDDADAVQLALQLPGVGADDASKNAELKLAVIDIDKATEGLRLFRQSNANGIAYERAWYAAGLPALTEWAFPRSAGRDASARGAILHLVESILAETNESILRDDIEYQGQVSAMTIPRATRQPLIDGLVVWATASHTELQSSLERAFVSEPWRKLAWWKLFWRVDDVGMILNELLERAWLVDAEKGVIFLAGRGAEAGIYHEVEAQPTADTVIEDGRDTIVSPLQTTSTDPDEALTVAIASEAAKPSATTPWPKTIPLARQQLNLTSIPPLQALAQSLIVQTLSLTSSATALSALLYLSLPTFSVFEAGAVGALGLVYSLRRMQKRWESARAQWQTTLRERGRVVLHGTEDGIRAALEREPVAVAKSQQDDPAAFGMQDRRVAREAVQRARAALEAVRASSDGSDHKK